MEFLDHIGSVSALSAYLTKQLFKELFTGDIEMCGHIGENGRKGADAKRRMLGNREMMLTMLVGGESEVTACLAGHRVAELAKGLSEITSGQIAGKPHTAITSSRTWCRRTTFGACPSSK